MPTHVNVATPKWPLIKPSLSAHMFSVRSNYLVWKRLRAHFSSGQWSGTCLIRGNFSLRWSDQRQFWVHTRLIIGHFERTLVRADWWEADSRQFFKLFCFSTESVKKNCQESTIQKNSDQSLIGILMSWPETRGPADSNCRSPLETLWNNCRSRRYAKLSKFIYSVKNMNYWHTQ